MHVKLAVKWKIYLPRYHSFQHTALQTSKIRSFSGLKRRWIIKNSASKSFHFKAFVLLSLNMCLACQNHLRYLFLFQATNLHFGAKNNGLLHALQINSFSEDTRPPDFCVVNQRQIGPHSTDYFQIIKAKKCFLSPSQSLLSSWYWGIKML